MIVAERLNTPVSTGELQRRWTAVRTDMAEQQIDVLLMQNDNDFMGGYVKWFSDLPAFNGYPVTLAFPVDAGMTMVMQGPHGVERFPTEDDAELRGVDRVHFVSSFVSAAYSLDYDTDAIATALRRNAHAVIGVVGPGTMPMSMIDRLRRDLPQARFVDATDLVDGIKCVKSEEEIALIRRCAELQDTCMEAVFTNIRPGMRDIEVGALAEQVGHGLGSEQGIFLCASMPVGVPGHFRPRHYQNRVIREGDYVALLIESSGPGGQYCELGRTCVLGEASDAMREEMDFVERALLFTVEQLRPGAGGPEIWDAHNQFMIDNGRPPERRVYCHGQGYDLVERPLVRYDEPMTIRAGMNLACHPTYEIPTGLHWCSDNVLVGATGTELIHKTPRSVREIG